MCELKGQTETLVYPATFPQFGRSLRDTPVGKKCVLVESMMGTVPPGPDSRSHRAKESVNSKGGQRSGCLPPFIFFFNGI